MTVQRWEYTFAYARTDPDGVWICPIGEHDVLMSAFFASLGDDGWELVTSAGPTESTDGSVTFIFKRPKA